MIERLLAAEAALQREDLDAAEKLFGQVAVADPRNAIAAVGMGRVAAGRDDAEGARSWFQRALEIDPDEAAARRLLAALDREAPPIPAAPASTTTVPDLAAQRLAAPEPGAPSTAPRTATATQAPRRSLLDRLRALLGLGASGRGR